METIDKGLIIPSFKEIRKAQGVSQQQIADHLKVQRQTVASWENMERTAFPTIKQAEEIADFLGFKIELILKTK